MRVHCWLPDALAAEAAERIPEASFSQLLQEAVRGILGCEHVELACETCAQPIDRWALRDEWLDRFYTEMLWALEPLVQRCGTAEGAARVIKDIALRHQIKAAGVLPLPRPSRASRDAAPGGRRRRGAGQPTVEEEDIA